MLSQFLALTLINTFSWFGGQGYCAYDFAILEGGDEITNVEIVLRPDYDPNDTASGQTELPDTTMTFEVLGGSSVSSSATGKIETDCNVTGFRIVSATAQSGGAALDLIEAGRIDIDSYKPLPLTLAK